MRGFGGWLAAATAATATNVGGSTTAVIVDEQQNDDHQQNPVAVVTAKQVTQTHTSTSFKGLAESGDLAFPLPPYIPIVCQIYGWVIEKWMYITPKICLYCIGKRRGYDVSV